MLTQVAGRAGRADRPGQVVVQTYNPDHYAIITASRHDFQGFYEREMGHRQQSLYPPFARLARFVFSAEEDPAAKATARLFAEQLEQMGVKAKDGNLHYVGPAEAPLHKLRGRYRYSILLKSLTHDDLPPAAAEALARFTPPTGAAVTVDIDPMDMM